MELVLVGDKPLATAAVLNFGTGPDALLIDATKLEFACPLDLAGIVATAHWAATESMPVTLRLPFEEAARSYLQRMDVMRLMPSRTRVVGRASSETRANLQDRLLEVTRVTPDTVDGVGETLGRLVTAFYANYSGAAGHIVYRACGELLANATEHGQSTAGAFVAAQTYTGGTTGVPRLEFAVCDTGIGVLAHLRRNPSFTYLARDDIALAKAIEAGVSGVAGDRGHGLSDLIDHTRRYGSVQFEMRSGCGEITVVGTADASRSRQGSRSDQTSGTWAWLTHRQP
jgi:hypothetical protein